MKKYILLSIISFLIISGNIVFAESIYEIQYNTTSPGLPGLTCYPSPELKNSVTVTGVVTAVDPDRPTISIYRMLIHYGAEITFTIPAKHRQWGIL